MTYNWRKGMLTWNWGEIVLGNDIVGFLCFWFPNCAFTVGFPEEP